MWLENIPSVSHFERGRVMVMWEEEMSPLSRASSEGGDVVGKCPLRLTFRAREGVAMWVENVPSVSHFERGRGGDVDGKYPLRLALRAREDDGDVGRGNIPSALCFERGRGGGGGVVGKHPTQVSSERRQWCG
jgi:hypothetical protein